jgi:hypothetical protein
MSNVVIPDAEVNQVLSMLTELLKYMQRHSSKYLDLKDYQTANEGCNINATEQRSAEDSTCNSK